MKPILLFLSLLVALNGYGQSIQRAEYFFDNDPGFGHGTAVSVNAGPIVDLNFNASTTGLSPGIHNLFIRVKSSRWSQVYSQLIGLSPNTGISRAEYFFDTDPGFGQGTPIAVTPGTFVNLNFVTNTTGFTPGIHTLFVRVYDRFWSQCHSRFVCLSADPRITKAEYFIDTDPGYGQGTSVAVTPGKVIELNFNAVASVLTPGIHTLFVRVKSDQWSQTYPRLISVSPDIGITKAEYFYGPDPGFGNGIPIPVTPGKVVSLDFTIPDPNFANGLSHIYVRTFAGKWGQTFIHEFCQNPVPNFSTDVAQLGNPTTFTNLTQNADPGTIFQWDVNGDGLWEHTGGDNFLYQYNAAGSYNAKLQVVSPGGCTSFIFKEVLVYACMAPTALTTAGITYQSAELSWTPGTFGNQWDIKYGVQGFNPVTGGTLLSGITSRPYTLSGLSPLTAYDFYVRTVCNGEVSIWAGPKTFTTAAYICAPVWLLSPNYQYNMQVVGKLLTGGIQSLNPNDKIGAFVNGQCRGIASPDPNLFGLIFLTIGSNLPSGEMVQFVVWKVSECTECPTGQSMGFQNQLQVGSPGNPYPFACGQQTLPIAFGSGYTWFSVNVNPGNMGLNSLLTGLAPCEGDRVIGQTSFAVAYNNSWVGSLSSINPAQMYKMQLCSQQNLSIAGQPVGNTPLSLGAGYNWIGFLPQSNMAINTALANITPAPAENNRVLGQNAFAVYYQGQWIGSLTQMNPGKGYIIELSSASTLSYPVAADGVNLDPQPQIESPTGEQPLAFQQFSMMLIAKLQLPGGAISLNSRDVVYAYADNECRGMAVPGKENGGALFMSVGADLSAGEKIRFKAWLNDYGILADISESLVFESLKKYGTIDEPVLLTVSGYTGSGSTPREVVFIGDPYPNPFSDKTGIPVNLTMAADVKLSLFEGLGQLPVSITNQYCLPGRSSVSVFSNNLPSGIYFYRIEIPIGNRTVQKSGKLIIYRK